MGVILSVNQSPVVYRWISTNKLQKIDRIYSKLASKNAELDQIKRNSIKKTIKKCRARIIKLLKKNRLQYPHTSAKQAKIISYYFSISENSPHLPFKIKRSAVQKSHFKDLRDRYYSSILLKYKTDT